MDEFIKILKIILIAIVEGITEWLPVSSTGHMILLGEWLSVEETFGQAFWDLFIVVVQLFAVMAVLITFIKDVWPWGKSLLPEDKKKRWLLLLNILIACIPAGVFGIILSVTGANDYLMNYITVSVTLIVYGIVFILVEWLFKKNNKEFKDCDLYAITWRDALIIGCAQILSLIPGTSRSGVTIIAALLLSYNRGVAAKFSFLVSIPIMIAASAYESVSFAVKGGSLSGMEWGYLFIGGIIAFVVSFFVVRYFLKFLKTKTFTPFGWYRIGLGLVVLIYFLVVTYGVPPDAASDASSSLGNIKKPLSAMGKAASGVLFGLAAR
jgi:undecaprenyl-diphosphatase